MLLESIVYHTGVASGRLCNMQESVREQNTTFWIFSTESNRAYFHCIYIADLLLHDLHTNVHIIK